MDAYPRYNQITMYPFDSEMTFFITKDDIYYYNVMSFGLKNMGATYERMVTQIFQTLLDKTMEVYVDDMLVKSQEQVEHLVHIHQAFKLLRRYKLKLNPLKCAFRVGSGKFLNYLVIATQIEHILDNNSHEFHIFWAVNMHKTLN